uniref:ATP synthase F0 subunit 8 n=1 Tax=Euurobracon yokahamae TaxID=2911681 RepID=UPI002079AE87|nr:ATP synthase F0 subunit 8 [Euurobracon yokahamae]UJJ81886.1 ATP synthase F0 subunit 8 [Euurobracon yokahamae]
MPQLSPMNWFFLSMYMLLIYLMIMVLIYFFMKFNFLNKILLKKKNNFILKW